MSPLNPRDYAAAVLAEPSSDRRKALIERCPAEWRALVEEHVRSVFPKAIAYRQHLAGRAAQARMRPEAAARRESCTNITNHPRSAPEVGNAAIARLRAAIGKGAA